jgi:ornithine cyclodeaminase
MAARRLARPDSRVMALIGNGSQSEFQALGFAGLLGIRSLRLYDVDAAATRKLMRNLADADVELRACASVAEAVQGADIVTTLTADKTRATVLQASCCARHAHQRRGRRLPGQDRAGRGHPAARARVRRVRAADAHRRRAAARGARLRRHRALARAGRPGPGRRDAAEITLFDSVGFALEDYSAMRCLQALGRAHGLLESLALMPALRPQGPVQPGARGGRRYHLGMNAPTPSRSSARPPTSAPAAWAPAWGRTRCAWPSSARRCSARAAPCATWATWPARPTRAARATPPAACATWPRC